MKRRVLYVDDELGLPKVDSRLDLIRLAQIEVMTARNREEALAILKAHDDSIAVVVLDLIMPYEDAYGGGHEGGEATTGVGLLQELRRVAPRLPIIVYSIMTTERITPLLREHRISRFVRKHSSSIGELVEALRAAIAVGTEDR